MSKVELIDKNELWAKRHAVDDYGREPYVVDAEDVFYAEVIQAIPLDRIKQAKEEIKQNAYPIVHGVNNTDMGMTLNGIFQVLDKLIESEEING